MLAAPPSDDGFDFASRASQLFAGIPCGAVLGDERSLESARPDEDLLTAVSRMWWGQVGALPVLEDGRLVGCFAEEDLLRELAEGLLERGPAQGPQPVWDELLAKRRVADAMTPLARLPVAGSDAPLLEALRASSPDGSGGRYLFLVDEGDAGQTVRLASFRDVARLLTGLYDGSAPRALLARVEADTRVALQSALGRTIGSVRRANRLGHEPNVVPLGATVAEAVRAMWAGRRGYVVATLPDAGPIGILTRRDVLRACARRHADLASLRLSAFMSPRVLTVTETDTLCGLFKLMALASCRHMPLVDDWDHVQAVISMWEGVSLVVGASPPPAA